MHTTSNLTNLEYLKLMSDGDQEMEMTMLEMLLEELPTEFEKMKALHTVRDWEELSRVSHKMKSTLAFIGNEDLTTANLKIEHLTKREMPPNNDEIQVIGKMMELFDGLLPRVLEELQTVARSY